MVDVSFGEWLKRRRKGMGLTQQQLAARINYSTIALKKIEAEERRPSPEIVERLAEVFSIPAEERRKFLRFARGDWKSVPSDAMEHAPWHTVRLTQRSNLPSVPTSLIGRDHELLAIGEYLSGPGKRLITLTGPPGIGKTRLSIEAARLSLRNFPDGVFFVALAPLEDPLLITHTIAQALGYVEAKNMPARQQIMDGIGGKQMLIVLDNCEHLIEDVASLASDLLSSCPKLKILATSRESLRVPGEWLCPVPTLDVPKESSSIDLETTPKFPALTLFAERACAVRPDFVLNAENIQVVSAICTQVDGLPLAIELMAARMRLMSPQALLDRLSGLYILTADGMRSSSERQKTLSNAIRWSYNLLSAEEQKLFTYLSVFSGGFTLDAAEAMFSQNFTGKSLPYLIALLLDKSLLQRALGREERLPVRYTMLATIQEFARGRLLEMGGPTDLRNRHLTYFRELAEQANLQLRGPEQLPWLDRLDAEYDNIRAALHWAQETGAIIDALHLVTHLELFWIWRAHVQEPVLALENLLAQPLPADQAQTFARGHRLAWHLYAVMGNRIQAQAHAQEDERLSLLLGPEGKVDRAENRMRFIWLTIPEEPIQVRQKFDEVFNLLQEIGDQGEMALWTHRMGQALMRGDDFMGARQAFEQSLKLYQECGDRISMFHPHQSLAILALKDGNYSEARTQLEELLSFCRQARLNIWIDIPLWLLGVIAIRERDYLRAKAWYTECLIFDQQIGLHRQLAECFIGFAGIANTEKHFEGGAILLGMAETDMEARGPLPTDRLDHFDQIEFERLTAVLREELGNARFEALASEGRTMTMEQAIEYALQFSGST